MDVIMLSDDATCCPARLRLTKKEYTYAEQIPSVDMWWKWTRVPAGPRSRRRLPGS